MDFEVPVCKNYSTNQPQLKRDTRAKRKKTHVTRVQIQKSNFACACVCKLKNECTVAGSLSIGAS